MQTWCEAGRLAYTNIYALTLSLKRIRPFFLICVIVWSDLGKLKPDFMLLFGSDFHPIVLQNFAANVEHFAVKNFCYSHITLSCATATPIICNYIKWLVISSTPWFSILSLWWVVTMTLTEQTFMYSEQNEGTTLGRCILFPTACCRE